MDHLQEGTYAWMPNWIAAGEVLSRYRWNESRKIRSSRKISLHAGDTRNYSVFYNIGLMFLDSGITA